MCCSVTHCIWLCVCVCAHTGAWSVWHGAGQHSAALLRDHGDHSHQEGGVSVQTDLPQLPVKVGSFSSHHWTLRKADASRTVSAQTKRIWFLNWLTFDLYSSLHLITSTNQRIILFHAQISVWHFSGTCRGKVVKNYRSHNNVVWELTIQRHHSSEFRWRGVCLCAVNVSSWS